ncbi:S41 family peptidase [Dysgonomonas alginatilytica]|nr:S41 family peptidase [Dysgonomonas alginatilytica]
MRRIQSLFFLLLLAFFSQAQNTCDCQENLKLLDEILSNNYAGYQYKKKTNGIVLDKLYNELLKEAKKERYQNYNCARLLDAYITAYEDKHTNIDYLGLRHSIGKMSEKEKAALFGIVAENKYLDSKQLSRYLEELQRGIEGVYVNKEDTCIVLEDRNILHDYIGVLWNTHQKYWNRGDVKFELKQNSKKQYDYFYYDKHHSLESLRDIDISINNIAGWRKIHVKSDSLIQEENRFPVSAQKQTDSTLYLPLQTFDRSYKAVIDNFLDSNKEKLEKTPNLILDLRGNKGGG